MKRYKPFAELPERLVLTQYETHILVEARAIIEKARALTDSAALGRADSALDDVLAEYKELR
jgi:hypothetical protein